ncbi:MAG: dicarboxylate/amino acid:cation symporter [Planctomycetota bacterium]
MAFHWKVLIWMLAGVLAGVGLQFATDAPVSTGLVVRPVESGVEVVSAAGSADARIGGVRAGDRIAAVWLDRDDATTRTALGSPEELDAVAGALAPGATLWFEKQGGGFASQTLVLAESSPRARILGPFDFVAKLFMQLLKMLIVPLVLTSIVSGVAGVGNMGVLKRLGLKTFAYYVSTSLLAILLGQILVTVIRPGDGAKLGLGESAKGAEELGFLDILLRMIPENVPAALTDNGAMLSVIFFGLVLGVSISRAELPHADRMRDFFESAFHVMMRLAEGVLALLPYGVFALMIRVVGRTGFEAFQPLALYMVTVVLALFLHAGVTLPLVVRVVGGISPWRWARAMSPALMTAFSTSSSSMTLPVTMDTVEKRGRVSNKVSSFCLPLGATINMDGTALYECIGVIFLAQYYAGTQGFELTLASQALVVLMALLASIGAAGIPSAGLVMMLTILSALGLPLEGAALLLAVDRPLDMLRTVVNVWSDSCGAGVLARLEGEEGPLAPVG